MTERGRDHKGFGFLVRQSMLTIVSSYITVNTVKVMEYSIELTKREDPFCPKVMYVFVKSMMSTSIQVLDASNVSLMITKP